MNFAEETRLVAILVQSKDRDRILPLIPKDFFEDSILASIVTILTSIWTQYKAIPTEAEFRSLVLKGMVLKKSSIAEQAILANLLADVYRKVVVTPASLEDLKERIVRKILSSSLVEVSEGKDTMNTLGKVRQRLDTLSAMVSYTGSSNDGANLLTQKYLKERAKKMMEAPVELIKLGYPRLDKAAGGGHQRGEFVLLAAPIGGSKTITMINVAVNLLQQGYNVLYINMDLPTSRFEDRMYACITGTPINDEISLNAQQMQVEEWTQAHGLLDNHFRYEAPQPETLTVSALRGMVQRIDDTYGPRDIIMIEMGDQILPDVKNENKVYALNSVFEGMRGLGRDAEVKKLVIASTWTNYEGWDPEKERTTTIKNMGDSKGKARCCQFGWAIDQTRSEKKHDPPLARWNIFKATNGEDAKTIPVIIDYKHMKVSEASIETYNFFKGHQPGGNKNSTTPKIGNDSYAIPAGVPSGPSAPPEGVW